MKAISLWQPWASAIAIGSKRIETRSWSTSYRGPLLIHAAKRKVSSELLNFQSLWSWLGALRPLLRSDMHLLEEALPFGAIVATCDVVDCRPTESFTLGEVCAPRLPAGETNPLYTWTEEQLGDFSPNRFGWVLDNILAFCEPIPYRGAQGFFFVPDELVKGRAQRCWT